MMLLRWVKIIAVCAAVVFPMSASAALISYSFTGGAEGSLGEQASFTELGITVNVSALKNFDSDEPTAAKIHLNIDNGLGVKNTPNSNRIGTNEALVFDWSPLNVTFLQGLIFEHNNGRESFDIYIDGDRVNDGFIISGGGRDESTIVSVDLSNLNLFGKVFTIVGTGGSGIRVAGLTIEADVPAPATLGLFGLSVFAMALRARRQLAK